MVSDVLPCLSDEQDAMVERCASPVDLYSLEDDEQDTLLWLVTQGLVEKEHNTLACTTYVVSQPGKVYLSAKKKKAEEVAQNAAEKKTEKHNEHVFEVKLSLLSALAGAVLTLIVEHAGDIFRFFHNLFVPPVP